MKKTICSLAALTLLVACTATRTKAPGIALGPNSGPQKAVTITGRDRGKYVALQPKGTLTVELEANTSAGYHWKLARPLDSSILQLVSKGGNLPPIVARFWKRFLLPPPLWLLQ